MPFDPVDPRQSLPDLERGILQYWKEEDIFKRSIHKSEDSSLTSDVFSFYDGPPFATGLPHYGHLLAGTVKDVIPRYQTMRGKSVARRFGWDCHGLPIENLVEKEEGITDRKEIEERGVKWFNDLCRASVQRYTAEWKQAVERMGRWVDMDWDYRTMDPEFMESIWWVFKQLHEKGLIYEGKKSMHVCPRCVTPLSNFEVTLGYQDIQDYTTVSIFPLTEDPSTALLAWTTTTWTLPGNLFLAIHPDVTYTKVSVEGEKCSYIVAKDLVESVFKDKQYEVLEDIKASDLEGKTYTPLFPYYEEEFRDTAFRIVYGDFVTTEDGTGIVHIATGFGTDDYEVGRREGVEALMHVRMDGTFTDQVTDFAGQEVRPKDDHQKTDKVIAKHLESNGRLFRGETVQHSYPHCWRCDNPLINYSTESWFVAVEKIKEDLLNANAKTTWVPAHVRDGRFGNWLEGARDWAISRNRYWGTPLPIWKTESGDVHVVGSRDELMQLAPKRFTKITVLRHAESEGNLIPIYQGKNPGTDLTKQGEQDAAAAGTWLSSSDGTAPTIIYTSPLARTVQTADILKQHLDADVVEDERLREIDFGEYEGKTIDFSDLAFIKERRAHKITSGKPESIYHFDGMETWDSAQERTASFFQEVLEKHPGEHIVVVTHADLVINTKHFFTGEEPLKLSHQPYPEKAVPFAYFWDHDTGAQMDLHKETVASITWEGPNGETFECIGDVLDCWFESGSMPYAQAHYPFEYMSGQRLAVSDQPSGFPADFISENLDQTRGWFYTLMVLSTALFDQPAFHNCICGGMILAEDGKKMSKKLKNYPDPMELMDRQGADAMRFALMESPVVRAETLKYSERTVEETVRNVLLPLWNTYAFFVTYANASRFESSRTQAKPVHDLDKWILAEIQDLTNRMTEELDRYDLSSTCGQLHRTIDALTNWYVRRSRRRFAGKEGEDAQRQALQTLYDVLIQMSQVLAPFCPFITEAMYLNLSDEEHGSVHLTNWPETRQLSGDEQTLLERTRLLRTIVSLGMKVRAEGKVKVRQPIASVEVALPKSYTSLSDAERSIIAEEINAKDVSEASDPTALGSAAAFVDARKVGPRLGKKVQEVIQAAKSGDFTEQDDGSILVGDAVVSEGEYEIRYIGNEGDAVAGDKGVVVRLDLEISDELRSEGLARDLIRAIQKLRKDQGLSYTDQIVLQIEGLEDVIKVHRNLIARETRAEWKENDGTKEEVEIEGEKCVILFEKI